MNANKKLEEMIGLTLLFGILLSLILVLIGGILFLFQEGTQSLDQALLQIGNYHITVKQIWHTLLTFSPIGLIELGLYLLVMTQVLRVAMLVGFYGFIRDYWFTCISLFILVVLIYSLFLRSI